MRVITANLNGIRSAAKKGFFTWLSHQHADVVCLQETKAQEHQLGEEIYCPKGFYCYYVDAQKKGYSGVAIYSRHEPQKIHYGLDWQPADDEGRYVQVDFENNRITLPKIRDIKCVFSRRFSGKMKTVTISKTPADHYFVSILVETKDVASPKPLITREKAVGIDLGLKDFAILSTGEKIANPRFNYKEQPKLRHLNRRISRQFRMNKVHSNNRNKNCIKRARLFEKISNRRNDFHHKLSSKIVSENQTICIEDLAVANLMKNHKVAESFASVSLGEFVRQLEYKCLWYGKNLIRIGRFDPSSKISNCCGDYNNNLKLSDRFWVCSKCGQTLDRDINAANNIRDFALQRQNLITQVPLEERELTLQEIVPLLAREKLSASSVVE